MSPEKQRIAIAEACGWTAEHKGLWVEDLKTYAALPDYLNDLNAMHEAEKILSDGDNDRWMNGIYSLITREWQLEGRSILGNAIAKEVAVYRASASIRAEAFLRTIGKWEESE